MEKWKEIAQKYFLEEFNLYLIKSGVNRRPDGVEFTTIEGDVSRRDLTINALFYDIETSEVVDLVDGVKALHYKCREFLDVKDYSGIKEFLVGYEETGINVVYTVILLLQYFKTTSELGPLYTEMHQFFDVEIKKFKNN